MEQTAHRGSRRVRRSGQSAHSWTDTAVPLSRLPESIARPVIRRTPDQSGGGGPLPAGAAAKLMEKS